MRIRNHTQGKLVVGILTMTLAFWGCGKSDDDDRGGGGKDEIEDLGDIDGETNNGESEETAGSGNNAIKVNSKVDNARPKVRNYSQFLYTYAGLLDVDPNDTQVQTEYAKIETNLPTGTAVSDFLGSHQLALVKLGSVVCEDAYRDKSAEERQKLFGLDPTAQAPIDAFGAINVLNMGKTIMSRFWGLEKDKIADSDPNLQILTGMVGEAMIALEEKDSNMTDAERVRLGTIAMCTAAITSAQVSFYGY